MIYDYSLRKGMPANNRKMKLQEQKKPIIKYKKLK